MTSLSTSSLVQSGRCESATFTVRWQLRVLPAKSRPSTVTMVVPTRNGCVSRFTQTFFTPLMYQWKSFICTLSSKKSVMAVPSFVMMFTPL